MSAYGSDSDDSDVPPFDKHLAQPPAQRSISKPIDFSNTSSANITDQRDDPSYADDGTVADFEQGVRSDLEEERLAVPDVEALSGEENIEEDDDADIVIDGAVVHTKHN